MLGQVSTKSQEITWGRVTSLSPVEVRFAGDATSMPVGFKTEGLSLSTSDMVMLGKIGKPDAWAIIAKYVAT